LTLVFIEMMTKDRHSNDTEVAFYLTWISTIQWRKLANISPALWKLKNIKLTEFGLGEFNLMMKQRVNSEV